ncbi:MAG: LytTR family DNA-binding domain-containing protein [Candidatus Kapabacteria bacterium]|jgi:two-component system LytT family response regulator|nr:LytTR family DNA-binding domain-containing protein [Candidatus Kapabacteria bacterium]
MHKLITAIIVDDEDLARQKIRHFLSDDTDCVVLAECPNGFSAVEAVCETVPSVIFMDIQMPELNGFETLQMIRDSLDEGSRMPLVVFITAYDHYAMKAFEAHAVDYLLKPFDYERFHAMFQRIKEQLSAQNALREQDTLRQELALLKASSAGNYTERFAFKTRGRIYFVNVEDIDWIEADRNYALFHVGEMIHVYRSTFGELEQQLNPAQFLRIHRSAIVRTTFINEILPRSERSYELVLKNGVTLDIGIHFKDSVFAALGLQAPKE